ARERQPVFSSKSSLSRCHGTFAFFLCPRRRRCYSPCRRLPRFTDLRRNHGMSMYIGEALVGEGNEVSHIDLLIGNKDGPVGAAFANALARQSAGHSNLLAVLT